MTLTWRQLVAYCELNDTLDRIERAHALQVAVVGAQGDDVMIKDHFLELLDGQ